MDIPRRALLRGGGMAAIAGLAGCLGNQCTHSATLRLTRASDDVLAGRFSDPVTVATLGPAGRRLAEVAIERGATTYRAGDPLVRDGRFAHGGRYYRLSSSVTATSTVRGYRFDAEFRPRPAGTGGPAEPGRTIAFEELPEVDRRALLYGPLNELGRKILLGDDDTGGGGSGPARLLYPDDRAREASVLVPEPEYDAIAYEGYLIRLSGGETLPDATLRTIELRAEELADSPAAFADHVVENLLGDPVRLDRDALTADQREIVEEAISAEFGYSACVDEGSSAPAFRELVGRIFAMEGDLRHAAPEEPRLVVYGDRRYLATYGVAVA